MQRLAQWAGLVDPQAQAIAIPQEKGLSLRPETMAEYIGQQHIKDSLSVAIKATQMRQEALPHILLYGPPGLGKTTLAHIIANEKGTSFTSTSGPALQSPLALAQIIAYQTTGHSILFIDEIHRMPTAVQEILYSVMEDFHIEFAMRQDGQLKNISSDLFPFTIIGASTRIGDLSAPLRDRFGLTYHLNFYTDEELAQVVKRSASILGLTITREAALALARCSRGTPRIANHLLGRARDYADAKNLPELTEPVVRAALQLEGIDSQGLNAMDRLYLATLAEQYNGKPVGVDAIAATLNEERNILTDVIEPYLLKAGLISRTSKGRLLTEKGTRAIR